MAEGIGDDYSQCCVSRFACVLLIVFIVVSEPEDQVCTITVAFVDCLWGLLESDDGQEISLLRNNLIKYVVSTSKLMDFATATTYTTCRGFVKTTCNIAPRRI